MQVMAQALCTWAIFAPILVQKIWSITYNTDIKFGEKEI